MFIFFASPKNILVGDQGKNPFVFKRVFAKKTTVGAVDTPNPSQPSLPLPRSTSNWRSALRNLFSSTVSNEEPLMLPPQDGPPEIPQEQLVTGAANETFIKSR